MKLVVIGGGSFFFTRQILKRIAKSDFFEGAEVCLVDIDPLRCAKLGPYASKFARESGGRFKVSCTTDRREVLPDADYVVFTFSRHNIHQRGIAAHICSNYGITEMSGDTAGPGSVIRIIRDIPEILEVASDVESLAPTANVINYTNPTNVVGAALDRYTDVNAYAFCDSMHLPYWAPRILEYIGVESTAENIDKLDVRVAGINHFAWLLGLKFDGEDVWDHFKRGITHASAQNDDPLLKGELDCIDIYDAWPTCLFHGSEYVRYFQGRGSMPERDFRVSMWSLDTRVRLVQDFWTRVDQYNEGTIEREAAYSEKLDDGEMIGDVIESIEGDIGLRFPINVRNDGRVSNLPDDAFVELFGILGKAGAQVPAVGAMPRGLLGLTQTMIDYQELALEAAMSGSVDLLVRAVASDPLVMSLADARDLVRDLLAAESEYLERDWRHAWQLEA